MTAQAYLNACGFVPTAGGTADFVVSAAVQGYQTPASAAAVNATVYSYRAESPDKSQWEIGFGTYTVSGTTLARTTVIASSTGAKVSFTSAPNVFVTAMAADLQNASLLTSGTLPVARINGGTANQFVQGDGSFQTQGRKLLNTLTASTPSDTTSLTSAFSDYEIVFENVVPSVGAMNLLLQVHSGGSFQATSYVTQTQANFGGAASFAQFTTGIQVSANQNNSAPGVSGTVRVLGPVSGASIAKKWAALMSGQTSTPAEVSVITTGYWNNTAAIDGFQVVPSSGVLTSGIIKVFGLT